ncbi:MAG: hypothetical protein CM1200mP14_28910 [Gammaproteobacteria bacterium]|nr:MAG: hypothetical protein CM1200mP14_28910 [Gammaproteobacteria bacterium]
MDASISMLAGEDELTPWDRAIERSRELMGEGWKVFTFGEVVNPFSLNEMDLGLALEMRILCWLRLSSMQPKEG